MRKKLHHPHEAVGLLITKTRADLGLSRSALAGELGVRPQSVAQWEAGKFLPKSEYLMPLMEFLGLEARDILEVSACPFCARPVGGDR